jgi:hypothetical protein
MMKKWFQTAKPDDRGESLRALQEVSKERITSVANQYFTNLWGVGGSQGRGAPSIEYRDRHKATKVAQEQRHKDKQQALFDAMKVWQSKNGSLDVLIP